MPRSVAIYVAALGAVALFLLLDAGRHIPQHDWPYLVVLGLFTVFFRLQHLQVRQNVSVSFVSAVNLLSILVAGGPAAIWVSALGNAAETLIKGRAPYQICYNISQSVISVFAAGSVFHLLGGRSGSAFAQPVAALVASAVYNLVNAALISRLFAFLRRRPFLALLYRTLMGEETLYFATGQVVAILGAALAVNQPVMGLGLVFAVLVLSQYAFKSYLRMYHDARERQKELEAVFNATQSAILVRDGAGMVRHANRPLLEMAGLDSAEGVVGKAYADVTANPRLAVLVAAAAAAGPADTPSLRAVVPTDLEPMRYLDYYRGHVAGPGADDEPPGTIEVFTDVTAVKAAEEKLRVVHASVLRAMTAAIDARDPYTHGHSTRVAEYSVRIARVLGLSDADIQRIHYSGLLHDIGKLGVDDRVLRKQGVLTPEERAAMMEHPVIGAQLLEKAGVFLELLPGVKHHHEWYNGGGYPDGVKGEQIPFDARIIGVADAFDAMTSDRPYRPALSPQEALNRLQSGRSIQFDSLVVDAFTRIWQAGEIVVDHRGPGPHPGALEAERAVAGVIRPVHRRELGILYRVARENYARMDLPAMLRRILEICHDAVAGHFYMILLVEPDTGDLQLQASMGHSHDLGSLRPYRGRGVAGRVAGTGKPLLLSHIDPAGEPMTVLPSSRSSCAVPLLYGGEVIGVLVAESHLPTGCTMDELYLFEAMAQQVASAVELARLQERLGRAAAPAE